ncbi:MAG: phage holin family protein [Patescibacteria group bacterium]|nr:phage holin family protein [Patescibacteria group bacterium]
MKRFLRSFIFYAVSFAAIAYTFPGLTYNKDFLTLAKAAAVFGFLALFVRPILKLLMLPINFLTLGFFSWVVNVIIIYLVTVFVPQFFIVSFQFEGFTYQGFIIPPMYLNVLWSAIVSSFLIGFVSSFLHWLMH